MKECTTCGKMKPEKDFSTRRRQYRSCKLCRYRDTERTRLKKAAMQISDVNYHDPYVRDESLSIDDQIELWARQGSEAMERFFECRILKQEFRR